MIYNFDLKTDRTRTNSLKWNEKEWTSFKKG